MKCPDKSAASVQSVIDVVQHLQNCKGKNLIYDPPGRLLAWVNADEVKQQRWHRLMQAQQKISTRRLKRKVGTRQQVIVDEVGPTVAKGRSKADAPEIDGAVYLSSRRPLKVGEIVTAKIERADQYDLHGSVAGF